MSHFRQTSGGTPPILFTNGSRSDGIIMLAQYFHLSIVPGDVLIAEDDADMQELIQRSLPPEIQGDEVRFFHDGRDLLNYLFRLGPHRDTSRYIPRLIVIDLDIPQVNGRAVVTILKSDERFRNIPAIVLTGNEGLQDKLMGLGADAYYIKPTDLLELRKLFKEIIKKWLH